MKTAYNLTRADMHYRHEVFSAGLRAAGYEVQKQLPARFNPGDVVLGWNNYGAVYEAGRRVEAAGGTFICAENGYIGKDAEGQQLYALARHGHNGSGEWYIGGPERWRGLGIEVEPWRIDGEHVLVCAQRGIGSPEMASPTHWHERAAERLRKVTKRPIKIRLHPGNKEAAIPLSDDLRGAWACVIWSSASGVKSLISGAPVFYDAPHWVCEGAARRITEVESGGVSDEARQAALERMAWAQWTLKEIEAGEPFRRLLA